jgi:transcriptional regulator with XRE-family HTH domain
VRRLSSTAVVGHVAAQLRRFRVDRGLTQQGLADLLGVTYQQAHKYETGVNRLPLDRLWIAAQVLGVAIGEFFPASDEQAKAPNGCIVGDRVFLDLARHYKAIRTERGRDCVELVARLLADPGMP